MDHEEPIEGLEAPIAVLVEKVSVCEFYAEMYHRVRLGSQSSKKLHSALPELYAAVLVFAAKARDYFEAGGTYVEYICLYVMFAEPQLGWKKRFPRPFKPFDVAFWHFIKEINAKQGVIQQCTDATTMERVRSMLILSPLFFSSSVPLSSVLHIRPLLRQEGKYNSTNYVG